MSLADTLQANGIKLPQTYINPSGAISEGVQPQTPAQVVNSISPKAPTVSPAVAAAQKSAAVSLPAANAPKLPTLPTSTTTAPSGFQSVLKPTDPAAIGGALMNAPAPNLPNLSSPSTPPPPSAPDPVKSAQDAYLATLGVSPDVQSATQALSGVSSKEAADAAAAQQAYASRVGAINEQATLQPFLTGRQAQASGELANQMAAIQSASSAQTIPLQQRLAQAQAAQTAQQAQAQAKLGFVTPKTTEVTAGNTVVDQYGKPVYTAPQKASSAQPTSSIQEYEFAKANGYTGSYSQYQTEDANRKAQATANSNDPNRILTATEAQSLGVPFGTSASQAYGLSPTKPLTESQAKDLTYATRASEANSYLAPLEAKITSMNPVSFQAQVLAEPNAIGNSFVSDDIRQLRQAERNFETAVLRRESGAAISASEFATDEKKYFPRPGDDAKTLAQKAQARQSAIDSMKASFQQQGSATTGDSSFSW